MYYFAIAALAYIANLQSTATSPSTSDVTPLSRLPQEVRTALTSIADMGKRFEGASCEYEVIRDDARVRRLRIQKDSFVATYWNSNRCSVNGRNPVYVFRLEGKTEESLIVVSSSRCEQIADDIIRRSFGNTSVTRSILDAVAFIGEYSLPDLVNNPACSVTVSPDWRKEDGTVEIKLVYTPANEPKPPESPPFTANVFLRRLPNQQWVIGSIHRTFHRKGLEPYGNNVSNDFAIDDRLGLPAVITSRIELWNNQGSTRKTIHQTIRLLSVGPYPDSDFTLSAFGLPEPFGIEWEKPTPWWLYISGGTLGLIAVMILTFWIRRWRTARQAAG